MVAISMHNSAYYSFFIALLIGLASCGSKPQQPIISGGADAELLNLTDSTVQLSSKQSPYENLTGAKPIVDLAITVDSNGIFMQPYDFPEGYYMFKYDQREVEFFIQKGKKLSFDFNAKTPMAMPEFSGKLKYESRYLWTKFLTVADFEASLLNHMSTTPSNYLAALSHYKSKLDTALVVYITNHPTGSQLFMKQESLHNYYFMANYIALYQTHLAEQQFSDSTINAMAQAYEVNLNDTNAFNLDIYYQFIEQVAFNNGAVVSNTIALNNYLSWVDTTFTESAPHDYLVAQLPSHIVKWQPSADRAHALDTVLQTITNTAIVDQLIPTIIADTTPVIDSISTPTP